jgi:hypothetical protein
VSDAREAAYALVEADLRDSGVTAVRFVRSGAVRLQLDRAGRRASSVDVVGSEAPTLIRAVEALLHKG